MKNKILILVASSLMLVGCTTQSKSEFISSMISGHDTDFVLTMADGDASSIVEELSRTVGGVSIGFTATTYLDDEVITKDEVVLSRVNDIEWATLRHTYQNNEHEEVVENYAGALKFVEEGAEVYYLDAESGNYEYYGMTYDPAINFSFEQLEQYLTLDDAYLAAAIALGDNGKYETIAGRKCLTFGIPGENVDLPGGRLTVSFDLESRLLMKCHANYLETTPDETFVHAANVDVTNFTNAGTVPTLYKD